MRPNVIFKPGRKGKTPTEEYSSLFVRTKELLHEDSRSLQKIADESGIPLQWIRNFSYNRGVDVSVHRVQKLYEFLAGKDLLV